MEQIFKMYFGKFNVCISQTAISLGKVRNAAAHLTYIEYCMVEAYLFYEATLKIYSNV